MNRKQAENVAIQALGWLASDAGQLGKFLNITGAQVEDLRQQANQPGFLISVLDYVMLSDDTILGFAEAAKLEPEQVTRAQFVLSGGGVQDWT